MGIAMKFYDFLWGMKLNPFTRLTSSPGPFSRREKGRKLIFLWIIMIICPNLFPAPFQELNKNFNRSRSHVTIRKIAQPTLANLDYAAYYANPIRRDPQSFQPKAPGKKIRLTDCSFGGAILHQCTSLQQTPLLSDEIEHAMAWEPLSKKVWEIFKNDAFSKIGWTIGSEKWADPTIFMPYQQIAAAYLHGSGDSASLWVKIEFEPWVGFLEGIGDQDHDGYKEIYGRVSMDGTDIKTVQSAFNWIRTVYLHKELSKAEIIDWANVLASYWYPKYNTDIVDTTGQTVWPNAQTEGEIKKEIKGAAAVKPLVVIRGDPFGEVIYNVFVIDLKEQKSATMHTEDGVHVRIKDMTRSLDSAVSPNFVQNNARFAEEIKENGGYSSWALKNAEFGKNLAAMLQALPKDQLGICGKDGWLFFSKGIDYLIAGDLNDQPEGKKPLPCIAEFQKYLASKNLPMLFAVVPDKSEVYFEKLPVNAPDAIYSIVNPYCRKFLKNLQDENVEVVDLLPLFLEAKKEDGKNREPLFQKQDTHWTTRGLKIAAEAIAQRIRQYGWYGSITPVKYSMKDTVIYRQGDIVDKLAEADRTKYPPVSYEAQQIFGPDGGLYKPNSPQSPILLIGDSFTGVFELIDCKGAGVGAHISVKTGIPVDIITSWGGGPLVRDKMLRARQKYLSYKRVVIYMMAARDLYNYSQGWAPLNVK